MTDRISYGPAYSVRGGSLLPLVPLLLESNDDEEDDEEEDDATTECDSEAIIYNTHAMVIVINSKARGEGQRKERFNGDGLCCSGRLRLFMAVNASYECG